MSFVLHNYVLSGNCYKIRLMAALLRVPYKTEPVDFFPGFEHRFKPMLALNPAGTLPVLVAGDLVLTETSAMLTWLAREFDPSDTWYPTAPEAMARVTEHLSIAQRLTESLGLARLQAMLGWPGDLAASRAKGIEDLRAFELILTDRVLESGTWLVGDHPTIADIAYFPYVALSPDAGLDHDGYPAIRNWLYAVRGLPGFVTMPGIHVRHDLVDAGVSENWSNSDQNPA